MFLRFSRLFHPPAPVFSTVGSGIRYPFVKGKAATAPRKSSKFVVLRCRNIPYVSSAKLRFFPKTPNKHREKASTFCIFRQLCRTSLPIFQIFSVGKMKDFEENSANKTSEVCCTKCRTLQWKVPRFAAQNAALYDGKFRGFWRTCKNLCFRL